MLANPDIGVTQIAHPLGVSPAMRYRYPRRANRCGPHTVSTAPNLLLFGDRREAHDRPILLGQRMADTDLSQRCFIALIAAIATGLLVLRPASASAIQP